MADVELAGDDVSDETSAVLVHEADLLLGAVDCVADFGRGFLYSVLTN